MPDRYLGDGVYASFDGYQVWLSTQEGRRIALEPAVMVQLDKYVSDIGAAFDEEAASDVAADGESQP